MPTACDRLAAAALGVRFGIVNTRRLGRTNVEVSEIGFGAWAIGGGWGATDDDGVAGGDARGRRRGSHVLRHRRRLRRRPLRAADRAGCCVSGRERLVVATKFGRRAPLDVAHYTLRQPPRLARALAREPRRRRRRPRPAPLPALGGLLRAARCSRPASVSSRKGSSRAYGVSVEKVEEALKAIEYPGVATVQIIFNIFRQRPAELFFEQARRRDVGVIVRVPLASGLLTGKFSAREPTSPPTTTATSTGTASVRRRRDVRRRRLRARARGRRRAAHARARGRDDGTARAALDPRLRRGLDGHPRREDARAGAGERGCGRPAAAAGRDAASGSPSCTGSASRRSWTNAGSSFLRREHSQQDQAEGIRDEAWAKLSARRTA